MDDFAHRIGEQMPRLRRYALALLRSEPDADDLIQDAA
jgi:DNA-directed RNA polymerase specialized sigma24 family protein